MGGVAVLLLIAIVSFLVVAILDIAEKREREESGKKLVTHINEARQKKPISRL